MFTKQHTEETRAKIAESRKDYTGSNHPRYGATWTEEQRLKYGLTMQQKRYEEQQLKAFLTKYAELYEEFKKQNKTKE